MSAMLGISFVVEVISRLIPIPGIMLYVGATLSPPYAITFFMESMIGHITQSRMGKRAWRRVKGAIGTGVIAGLSIVVSISVGISLLLNLGWI